MWHQADSPFTSNSIGALNVCSLQYYFRFPYPLARGSAAGIKSTTVQMKIEVLRNLCVVIGVK